MKKERLDTVIHARGMTTSRERARSEIMSGRVFVDGQRADKPGMLVPEGAQIELRGTGPSFVSRGGYKLEKALDTFQISPQDLICLDCGASTGGFTDCLLKRGAAKVYAVDVGYCQLAWALRNDPRVICMERTNARYLTPADIQDTPSLVVIDVSFISLRLILPVVRDIISDDGLVICLIKPQFEAGREKVGKKGVVRQAETHSEVLRDFMDYSRTIGFKVLGLDYSPVKGPEGNIEFLGILSAGTINDAEFDVDSIVAKAHKELD